MSRYIRNIEKLLRILEHATGSGNRPSDFCVFDVDDSLRIRQLIGEGLVAFFARLNGLPIPGPQPIPVDVPRSKKRNRRLA